MSEKAPSISTESLDDIVKVAKNGRAQREDGKFLSNHQLALIEEHQDIIRDNMDEYSDAPKERAEKAPAEYNEGDIVYVKSMSRDKAVRGTVKEFKVARIYTTGSGEKEVSLLSTDGAEDQRILYTSLQKNALDAPSDDRVETGSESSSTSADVSTGELRGVEDGEYGDDYLKRAENSDPNDPDYLPIGVMAHEPWTFADKEDSATTATTSNRNPGTSVVPAGEPSHPGYDGPVESGSEIEHVPGGTDIVPVPEVDPRTRIGDAINTRMAELMEGGMSESDAHAQAHDEFWGGDIHTNETTDDDETDDGGNEIVQTIEVDPALIKRLDQARTKYAELTAKSRKSYLGRFLQGTSRTGRLMRKIPGVATALSNLDAGLSSMRGFNAETTVAKEAYEDAYKALSEATAAELIRVGWEDDVVRSLSLIGNIAQDKLLEDHIASERQKQSKDTNRFVNWWVSQKGFKGKLMKAGAVIGVGAAVGLTGGIAAGPLGAYVAGGLAGGYIGKHVTKRRANGMDKDGWTVAAKQAAEDRSIKERRIRAEHAMDKDGNVLTDSEGNPIAEWGKDSITGVIDRTEARTGEEMLGNRRRVKTATALGAAAGRGAYKLAEGLYNHFGGHNGTPESPTKPKDPTTSKDPTPPKNPAPKPPQTPNAAPKPPTPEVPRPQFNVEPGSGFEREISQYFANNGKPISGSEAHKLYQSLEQRFGANGLIKPSETYLRSGTDYGISRPGVYEVADGPAKILSDWLAAK